MKPPPGLEARCRTQYREGVDCVERPLHAGLFVFLAWFVTGWFLWQLLGLLVLLGGAAFSLIALIHVFALFGHAKWLPPARRRRLRSRAVLLAGRIVLNYVVAGLVLHSVDVVERSLIVVVQNNRSTRAETVSYGGRGTVDIEPGRFAIWLGHFSQQLAWREEGEMRSVRIWDADEIPFRVWTHHHFRMAVYWD